MLRQASSTFTVETRGRGLVDFTRAVTAWVAQSGFETAAVSLTIPLDRGRLVLGTWQGTYLWEHRLRAHRREVAAHLLGE